ncbi:MAG TPA: TIGR03560 family F420-dependent LLM class oxidoreductase [Egibacteraceae bacterium]|nr:TIGR03560 family F420-dependent LLM class oxidoreductase [Egibacteraceae bacterium]
MRFGLDVAQHQLTWDELLARVRVAEEAGFDGAWLFDHFKPLYGDRKGPCLEGWTLLAALAAATSRVRLGTLVTGVTYRHPSVLAAQAVTVDHVSGGRLELGLGAAWFAQEHRELGIDFPDAGERVERLDEAVQVIKALLTTDDATVDGRHYRLDGATYRPRPVQRPYPPLWIGASGEQRMLPLAARHADVWHGFGDLETLGRRSAIVDEHARRAGRDPAAVARATDLSLSEPWDQVRGRLEALERLGFSYVVASWPSEGRDRLEEFVSAVMPAFSG